MKPKFFLFIIGLFTITLSVQAQSRKIMTFAGSGGTGGFSGDGFAATGALLHGPTSLSADRFGNVYIVDFYNFRVRKVKSNGTIVTFAGTGSFGSYIDSTVASSADIRPLGVAADRRGNVYISEPSYNVVYKVNTRGIITTYAGNNTYGYSGDGGKARRAQLALPFGLFVDKKDNLFIADAGNHVIRKVDTFGNISTVAGNGTLGYTGDGFPATDAQLDSPYAVCVDKHGALYIADHDNNVIRKVDTTGTISTFAGRGSVGYSGDGLQAIVARFNYPAGIAVDSSGNVYIADSHNNAIRMVDTLGRISTLAGNSAAGFGGDLGAPEGASLFDPYGLTIDTFQTLYIADANNQRVRRIYYPTVGVREVTNNTNIQLFPNPTAKAVTVTGLEHGYSVVVIDNRGRLVGDIINANNNANMVVDVAYLTPGNYYIRVLDANNAVAVVKAFVKQ